MYRILVADDEAKIRGVIREYAEFNGYEVIEASDGMEALTLCREKKPDLVILDVMMPRLDGFSACKEIRKFSDVPILMLSARGEEYDKLFGFELGVDDYVVKPFSPRELMARINAVLSRRKTAGAGDREAIEVLTFGELELNLTSHTISVAGTRVELTPKEYELLAFLVKNKNIALSRDTLLSEVWGYDFYGDDRTIDTHVKNLRSRLGSCRDMIVTVRGFGYRFEATDRSSK